MNREELFKMAYELHRKGLMLRGAGHISGALEAEEEYRKVCLRLALGK